jgi:DNA-binding NarL/FixJ family response regulator
MLRLLVADKNETIRTGICAVFRQQSSAVSISEASNKAELMAALRTEAHDLILMEPLLCGGTGEALIRQVCEAVPGANILVFSDLDELKFGLQALRSGAKGYLMKSCSSLELVAAARKVSQGRVHISEALAEEVALNVQESQDRQPHQTLTERELLVFSMLVCGWKVTDIAAALHLSIKTISTHKARAMSKLRCRGISDIMRYAISKNLTEECRARCAHL